MKSGLSMREKGGGETGGRTKQMAVWLSVGVNHDRRGPQQKSGESLPTIFYFYFIYFLAGPRCLSSYQVDKLANKKQSKAGTILYVYPNFFYSFLSIFLFPIE
jgi:hypothetical protein